MNDHKKNIKEQKLIVAAETIFSRVGFSNAKMEDISAEAGITKVTLYTYFQSKENLQLAVTHKALQLLNDTYYATIDQHKHESGLKATLALFRNFVKFNEDNFLYSEALLSYFQLIRSSAHGKLEQRLSDAINQSIYFRKLQDIQNLPFKLTAAEIQRGIEDKSIRADVDPMLITLAAWTASIGYIKLLSVTGKGIKPLFNVDLEKLKKVHLQSAYALLKNPAV